MPESFDTLLSEIAESAGSAVHPVGAAAARQRGHQRAVRRRFAASIMSVVLLGLGGGLAVALATNHSGKPAPVTHSPTPTPSSGPASPSASPSPSSSASSPGASASSAPPSGTGDLNTIVPGAWTPYDKFPPGDGTWKPIMNQPAIHTADRQWFYSCYGSGNTLTHLGASGYQEMTFTDPYRGSQNRVDADQVMFFFPSNDAAAQALATIRNDYAHCPELTTGTDGAAITGSVSQTEELDGSYAWMHAYQAVNGGPAYPADIAATNHEFFVRRGNVVEMVWFDGGNEIDDLQFLNRLNGSLCVYGGTCPASADPLSATITAAGSTSLALGGSPIEFNVTVTNNSDDTIGNIEPLVSLGHCTCSNTPVTAMPNGELQLWDTAGNDWKPVFYDIEGTGMDYVLSPGADQVPAFDLPAGQSVSFKYRVRLNPLSEQPKLSPPYQLSNGVASVGVTMIHPGTQGGSNPTENRQIGTSPVRVLPVTVTVN